MTPIPLHHTHDQTCPLCDYKLLQVHPYMVDWFNKLVKPKWQDSHISWGWRSEAEQNACLYANPPTTKLAFPLSAHNKSDASGNPQSLALDLFYLTLDHGVGWLETTAMVMEIDKLNEFNGLPILWGGKWRDLGDDDHFQYQPS